MSKILPHVIDALERGVDGMEVADILRDMIDNGMKATVINLSTAVPPNEKEDVEKEAPSGGGIYIDVDGNMFEISKVNQMKKVDYVVGKSFTSCILINPSPNPKGVYYEDSVIKFKTPQQRDEVWDNNKQILQEEFGIRFI